MILQQFRADNIVSKLFSYFSAINLSTGLHFLGTVFQIFSLLIALSLVFFILRKLLLLRKHLQEKAIFLELTPPTRTEQDAIATEKLFSLIHSLTNQRTLVDRLLGNKTNVSLEIVSSKDQGIRYLLGTTKKQANILRRSLLSYLPKLTVKIVNDYLPQDTKEYYSKIVEFKLSHHFAFPLNKQSDLMAHDPIAYITGMMTKLEPNELISLQLLLSPVKPKEVKKISNLILYNGDILEHLNSVRARGYLQIPIFLLKLTFSVIFSVIIFPFWVISTFVNNSISEFPNLLSKNVREDSNKTTFEQELVNSINSKVNQPLFEATLRVLVIVRNKKELGERLRGLTSAFASFSKAGHQAIVTKQNLGFSFVKRYLFFSFKTRLFALSTRSLFSVSEASDIYHFPFTTTTKTEDIVKSLSPELPAPLSLKKGRDLDVIFGKNTYGNTVTDIGLTDDERAKHVYLLGRTGSGKTTIIFHMASDDIRKGRGVAFIGPLMITDWRYGEGFANASALTVGDRLGRDYQTPMEAFYLGVDNQELDPELGNKPQIALQSGQQTPLTQLRIQNLLVPRFWHDLVKTDPEFLANMRSRLFQHYVSKGTLSIDLDPKIPKEIFTGDWDQAVASHPVFQDHPGDRIAILPTALGDPATEQLVAFTFKVGTDVQPIKDKTVQTTQWVDGIKQEICQPRKSDVAGVALLCTVSKLEAFKGHTLHFRVETDFGSDELTMHWNGEKWLEEVNYN